MLGEAYGQQQQGTARTGISSNTSTDQLVAAAGKTAAALTKEKSRWIHLVTKDNDG
uniref:Uncharacterized protein n=1 Tax=Oryza sativa subsp. japonica TaxID=39947 RepID=Q69LI3_ORYSJ|nr:hypothetical protein [Oryza sativa Japonica Group]BAD36447.1 hypothetical protein [Oryza sativa Japonica Group]